MSAAAALAAVAALGAWAARPSRRDDLPADGFPSRADPGLAAGSGIAARQLDEAARKLCRENAVLELSVQIAWCCVAGCLISIILFLSSAGVPGLAGWLLGSGGFWAAASSVLAWATVLVLLRQEEDGQDE